MSRKYTEQEIKEKIYELENGKYEMIGEYVNITTPFLMRYYVSENEFIDYHTTAHGFINHGQRYLKREKTTKWNTTLIRERIK